MFQLLFLCFIWSQPFFLLPSLVLPHIISPLYLRWLLRYARWVSCYLHARHIIWGFKKNLFLFEALQEKKINAWIIWLLIFFLWGFQDKRRVRWGMLEMRLSKYVDWNEHGAFVAKRLQCNDFRFSFRRCSLKLEKWHLTLLEVLLNKAP